MTQGKRSWQEGLRLFAAEDFRKAQDAFQQAVDENPQNSTYALWLGLALGRPCRGDDLACANSPRHRW